MSVHKFELTPVEFWEDDEVEIQDIVCGYRMSYRVKLKSTPYLDEKTIDGKEYAGYFAVGYDENNAYELYWSVINKDCEDASEACDWNKAYVRMI